jgi:hypothetical protein
MRTILAAIVLLTLMGCTTLNPCMKYEDPMQRVKCENLQANPCLGYSDPQAQINCQNAKAMERIVSGATTGPATTGSGFGPRPGAAPHGSYEKTCDANSINFTNNTLSANCKTSNGFSRASKLYDADQCRHDADVSNENGQLTCTLWSYRQTCTNIRISDDALTADCADRNNIKRQTRLNNPHSCHRDVANEDGRLTCQ